MRKLWLILIVPVLLLLWWGLGREKAAPEIHFSDVSRATIQSTVPTNGKVEPVEWAAARAETSGVIRQIAVGRGQSVQSGQILVTLDTTSAQSDLAAALARQQEASAANTVVGQGGKPANLAAANDAVAAAQAAVQVTQRSYDSVSRLESQQAATRLQVLEAKDAVERARMQLAAAQEQRRTLISPSDRDVAVARLRDAQAGVTLAQRRVSLGYVKSPIAGTVYQFDLKVGAYLQPGDLVALIGKLDRVKVTVYVDEPDLGRVAEGMPVSITWDARPGQKWWGRVDRLPTEVIALGTRTVGEVSTVVDNRDHDLLPGVTVNATIISKVVKSTLSIPKAALRNSGGATGVFKLTGKTIAWVQAQTGISDINNVQILSGLREGDKVADRVIEPSDAEVKDGMRVRPSFH